MVPSSLRLCLLAATLFLINMTTAFPLMSRDIEWSFTLFPTSSCNATGDPHAGSGSTGCRADLNSVASAYTLYSVAEGCRIEFFDNTMCDETELSDVAGQVNSTNTCHMAGPRRRYGSYQVTCE
ncbi:hypothetical protein PENANT_c002G04150 [Penicillium antarcticum]|uniref:Cyanovirin-N domain-containing protein n=1 Tax=Penicillium antarcticum TaxID=416450 RepID=A0A1V6QLA2_9EURO|nr:hypothetical protein PENANT_c002G04150 [Penicillium antarcticum]